MQILEKYANDFFYKDKILVKNLEVRYYNNHMKKNINKWV